MKLNPAQMNDLLAHLQGARLTSYSFENNILTSFRVEGLPFVLNNDDQNVIVRGWKGREGHVGLYAKNLNPNRIVLFLENDYQGDFISKATLG